jgi:nucleotide-binding universal stress UspA family protein
MPIFQSILCPVDFSDTSREALQRGATLTERHQGRLTILTAVDPLLARSAQARFKQDLRRETESFLSNFVGASLAGMESRTLSHELDVQIGQPADVILDAATRHSADVIVMGTHGLGGFQRLLLGSTTARVLRRTEVPVLAIPPAGDQTGGSTDTSRPRFPIGTVLVATDFSAPSDNAVRWAAKFAVEYGATLLVAHVVAPFIVPVEWVGYIEGIDDDRMSAARSQIDEQSTRTNTAGTETIVMLGPLVDSIDAIVQARNVDVIVMGLTGTERILAPRPGSTAYSVLVSVRVPALVVPDGVIFQ